LTTTSFLSIIFFSTNIFLVSSKGQILFDARIATFLGSRLG
jgi:hypothetical protein